MPEQRSDRQPYIPLPPSPLSVGDYFEAKARPGFRYRFPSAVETLAYDLKRKMNEGLLAEHPQLFHLGPNREDVRWGGILEYLRARNVIHSVSLDPPFTDEMKLYFFDIFSPFEPALTDGHAPQYSGYSRGVSEDYEEGVSKVIGEFLERYPLLLYRRKDLTRASIRDLERARAKFLDPRLLAGFSDEQKKRLPDLIYDEKSPFYWVSGRSLADGREALIPAQLVYWTYCRHHPGGLEPRLREANTNGAGGYFTREGALLSGLYECVQRDAFLSYWLNSQAPPLIDNATIEGPVVLDLLEQARRLQFEVRFLDVTSDIGVPAVFCALVNKSSYGPRVAFGGGCGPEPAEVLRRALTEAVGLFHWLRKKNISMYLPEPYVPFSDHRIGQLERLLLWSDPAMFERLQFFFKGRRETFNEFASRAPGVSFSGEADELAWLVGRMARFGAGYEPFAYEAKHPLLEELGYASAKVVVPALLPLYLAEHLATAGAPRLGEVMENLGLEPAAKLNPWPHPFP